MDDVFKDAAKADRAVNMVPGFFCGGVDDVV